MNIDVQLSTSVGDKGDLYQHARVLIHDPRDNVSISRTETAAVPTPHPTDALISNVVARGVRLGLSDLRYRQRYHSGRRQVA